MGIVYGLGTDLSLLPVFDPPVAPAGPMAQFVGPALAPEVVLKTCANNWDDNVEDIDQSLGHRFRLFPVLPLIGRTVTCAPAEFSPNLLNLLHEVLPGTTWDEANFGPDAGPRAPLKEKYRLLDGRWPAPPDEATGQAMYLTLTSHQIVNKEGAASNSGGVGPSGPDQGQWSRMPRRPFSAVVEVTVEHAHWANVQGISIGVGYYE